MRLGIYCDFPYRREGEVIFAEQPFALFMQGLAPHVEQLTLIGRLDPRPGRLPFRVADGVALAGLPHYERMSDPRRALPALVRSLGAFWRALDDLDMVWLLGPNPLSVAFALLAVARRRRVALGVRQDTVAYAVARHPGRRMLQAGAVLLDRAYRILGRRLPVVAVGPDLARRYAGGGPVLPICVSLVPAAELERARPEREYEEGELRVLSVGRLDAEKNPVLLADVLARLLALDRRWRLVVCGEGDQAEALAQRLDALGVADRAELRGYVPVDAGLADVYRESHALLHISWTEGFPQVLVEAFAADLPTVATRVGGVAELAGDAALLVPPGEAEAPAQAVARVGRDGELRERLVAAGRERAAAHTLEAECERLAAFLSAPVPELLPA